MQVLLRPGTPDDLVFVMETERLPGFRALVGRSRESEHRALIAEPGTAYLIAAPDGEGEPAGFAILKGLDDPHGNVLLKRIALRDPGSGLGRVVLRAVQAWAFARDAGPRHHRLYLDVFEHNERARRAYRSVGFQEDGVLREAYLHPDGERLTLVLMSILRREWEAQRGLAPPSAALAG